MDWALAVSLKMSTSQKTPNTVQNLIKFIYFYGDANWVNSINFGRVKLELTACYAIRMIEFKKNWESWH